MKEVHIQHNLQDPTPSHYYNIWTEVDSQKQKVSRLIRSSDSGWSPSVKSSEALRVIDDGNGLYVSIAGTDGTYHQNFRLDYDVAEELFILLTQQDFAPFEIKETKTTMKWPLSQ
jgi:hypothetical protein